MENRKIEISPESLIVYKAVPLPPEDLVALDKKITSLTMGDHATSLAQTMLKMGTLHKNRFTIDTIQLVNGQLVTLKDILGDKLSNIIDENGYIKSEYLSTLTSEDQMALWHIDCSIGTFLIAWEELWSPKNLTKVIPESRRAFISDNTDLINETELLAGDIIILKDHKGRNLHYMIYLGRISNQKVVISKNGGGSGGLLIPFNLTTLDDVIKDYHKHYKSIEYRRKKEIFEG